MDEVITLSSDSDKDDSDVEIVGCVTNMRTRADPLPLTAVRVDIDDVNVNIPKLYIDLTDPRWTLPELKVHKRRNSSALIVDLIETSVGKGTIQETEKLPPDDIQLKEESKNINLASNRGDCILQKSSSRDQTVFPLQRDCDELKPKQMRLDSQTHHQKKTGEVHDHTAVVKLRRLPFLETHITELKMTRCSQMSVHLRQLDNNAEAPESISIVNGPHMDPSLYESLVRQKELENSNEFTSTQLNVRISQHLRSPADSPCSDREGSVAPSKEHSTEDEFSSSHDKGQGSLQREVLCSKLENQELDKGTSRESDFSDQSFPASPATRPNPSESFDFDAQSHTDLTSHSVMRRVDPPPTSEPELAEDTLEWQSEEVKADEARNSSDWRSIPSEPALSNEDMDAGFGGETYEEDLNTNSPVAFLWHDGSDGDDKDRFEMDFRAASREDRQFVCPVTLRKIMCGPTQTLLAEDDEGFKTPEVLCRQSLSLVYSTIDENYPEGTLQLLSDLLQPGYYPPRDITSHLLHGILLDPECPHHQCVQAFNLLMRTQRHHKADKTSIPWDWGLLTSVMANQRLPCQVVRMLLEYVVQTLEDDFQAKRAISALHQSIAKATLSCDQHFPLVREVIKWLFSAIMKSTKHEEHRKAAMERDEQVRMVSIFQRMLSLALEVDCSPALTSAKLSQELFHMLISKVSLRAHRMLLLESLQSKLLRCKLLEHLLDYACPQKISLPMSLSLLLHFLKYCTLAPDPSDGNEKWQRWEELVHLLWMLLLSYNNAMKGYLCSSLSDQRHRVRNLVYKEDDLVSKLAIREAVEAFLSRSQADLGQALPLHMEESLSYLQDHLLDAAQC